MQNALVFTIPQFRLESIRKRLDAIVRRAHKKGLTHFEYSVSPETVIKQFSRLVPPDPFANPPTYSDHYEKYDVECVTVTINCPKPSLAGWWFVGRIEHLTGDDGESVNIVYAAPGETVPSKFHTGGPTCEHCQVNRYRKDTFIVATLQDNGTALPALISKQVGSTCLSDFLGVDAAAMLAYAELIESATSCCNTDMDEEMWGAMRQSRCYGLREVLNPAAALTLNKGYVSRRKADESMRAPTSEFIRSYLFGKEIERQKIINPEWWTDRVTTLVDSTVEWLSDLAASDPAELDDYTRNLAAVAKVGFCPVKAIGILGSAPYSFMLKQEREQQAAAASVSQHQGKVKERIVRDVTVLMARPYNSQFGPCGMIYKFVDADGNRYLWFASSGQDWTLGQKLTIKGTVKAHETDRFEGDCNVTLLNRVTTA